MLLRAPQPIQVVVNVVAREERAVADPARRAPAQRVQLDVWVASLGLLHQPPLVPAVKAQVVARVHVRRLGRLRALRVPADLGLEDLHGAALARVEEQVEDVGPLRIRIVVKQPRRAAAARERAQALKHAAGLPKIDAQRGGGRRTAGAGGDTGRREQQGLAAAHHQQHRGVAVSAIGDASCSF